MNRIEEITFKDSTKHCNPSASCVFKVKEIESDWYYIIHITGRYHPYFYIFNKNNYKTPLIIESTEEFNSYADINGINLEN